MAGPGVFNVSFGINETRLTQALELRRFNEAENLICENAHSTYLDEGCYQRTPFYIVLCGIGEVRNAVPRNLYIAKLLAENGADVNYRVPTMSVGAEYVGPGKSAVQLVVNLIIDLTSQIQVERGDLPCCENDLLPGLWVGLDGDPLVDKDLCIDQLFSLLLTLLSHGGDLQVRDWYGMTPLHQSVVLSTDERLTELLIDWGADLNAQDVFGNTPLAALCEAFPMGISYLYECEEGDLWETDPFDLLAHNVWHQRNKCSLRRFLLSQRNIKLDVQNKCGCTALFNAVIRGDTEAAHDLLRRGVDSSLKGQVTVEPKHSRSISPLFASLFSIRVSVFSHGLPDSHHFLAHLVDQEFFSSTEIVSELHSYIDTDFPVFHSLKLFGTELIHLLFGGTSASLRQLAARAMFTHFISENYRNAGFAEVQDMKIVRKLVQRHKLPQSTIPHFDIELFRLALFSKFSQFQRTLYESMDGSDNSDMSSGENDSDLEYW